MIRLNLHFRPLIESDWGQVSTIYLEGIETGKASFSRSVPSWPDWSDEHLRSCRIVAAANDEIVGWCALSPVSSRCVYGGVAEVSVYVAQKYSGHSIGTMLLERLIVESESHNIWTLQSGVFPENLASLRIHEKTGFRVIGHRERIGKLNNVWRDIILLERRSEKIGI